MNKYFGQHSIMALGILLIASAEAGVNAKVNVKSDAALVSSIKAQDEADIRAQAKDYAAAYARGDAHALAAQWAVDGTLTDTRGKQLRGRTSIEKSFSDFFKSQPIKPMVLEVESIKFPAANIAIEVGTTRLPSGDARYTAIHSKESGHWQMVAVFEHETPRVTSINELAWLVGSWGAQSNSDLRVQCDWTASKKFLQLNFYSNGSNSPTPSETEIIGWNPAAHTISSWHFNADGGIGFGRWKKDGDDWIVSARGADSSGTMGTAQYVLHKVDDNSYTWKSTKRFANGKSLPDSQEVLVLRRDQK